MAKITLFVSQDRIGVRGGVVEEPFDVCHRPGSGFCLGRSKGAECDEDGGIDGTTIVEKDTDDLAVIFDFILRHWR